MTEEQKKSNQEVFTQIIVSLSSSIVLSGIFLATFQFIGPGSSLHDLFTFRPTTLPWSLVTSSFIHNSQIHLDSNISSTIFFGTIFFYLKGIRKGYGYFILFGIIGHLLQFIFLIPLNFFLHFYFNVIQSQDWFNTQFFIVTPIGAGASIGIAGMCIIIAYESVKRYLKEYKKEVHFHFWKSIAYFFSISFFILIIGERVVADLASFCRFLYENWMESLDSDIITELFKFVTSFHSSIYPGNTSLSHIFGMIGGIILLLNEKFQFLRYIRIQILNKTRFV